MSGDARRALNICRRATELAQNCQGSGGGGGGLVGLKDIEAAVTEMFTSPKIRAMRLRSSVCVRVGVDGCVHAIRTCFYWLYIRTHVYSVLMCT